MPQVAITLEPWKGHAAQPDHAARTVKTLDPDETVCVLEGGEYVDVPAKRLLEDEFADAIIRTGTLYRVVAVSEK